MTATDLPSKQINEAGFLFTKINHSRIVLVAIPDVTRLSSTSVSPSCWNESSVRGASVVQRGLSCQPVVTSPTCGTQNQRSDRCYFVKASSVLLCSNIIQHQNHNQWTSHWQRETLCWEPHRVSRTLFLVYAKRTFWTWNCFSIEKIMTIKHICPHRYWGHKINLLILFSKIAPGTNIKKCNYLQSRELY